MRRSKKTIYVCTALNPQVGGDLIARIPRMERVAEIIAHQNMRLNDYSQPQPLNREAPVIITGSRILKVVLDFDKLLDSGNSLHGAFNELSARSGWYDPVILNVLKQLIDESIAEFTAAELHVSNLQPGMVVDEEIFSEGETVMLEKGQEITTSLMQRLQNFAFAGIIRDKIRVKIPANAKRDDALFIFQEGKTHLPGFFTESPAVILS